MERADDGGQERQREGRTGCETAEAAGRPSQAPQHLARAELALTTALGVLQEVKPAFVDLYGKLNDEQRERIDDLLDRKGRYRR